MSDTFTAYNSDPFNNVVGRTTAFAITANATKAFFGTKMSTYNGSSWTTATSIGGPAANYSSQACTPDGNIVVLCSRTSTGRCYFTKWNGSSYPAYTQTLDNTGRSYEGIDINGDGTRIVALDAWNGVIYFATWNGSNFSTFTATNITTNAYTGVGITRDGTRIAYTNASNTNSTVYSATWNGSNYGSPTIIGSNLPGNGGQQVRFSPNGNVVFVCFFSNTNASVRYAKWNSSTSTYSSFSNVPLTAIPASLDCSGLGLCENGSLYVPSYVPPGYWSTTTNLLTSVQVAPTIRFSIPAKTFGTDISFNLAPSSNSTGAFTFTSSNTAVATISGSTVTIIGAGSSTITLTQAATTNYLSATVTSELTVSRASPTITFNNIDKIFGDMSFNLVPASNSNGAFNFTSSDTSVASISGNIVTILKVGTSTITAIQDASGNYLSKTVTAILTVNQAIPTITFNIPIKTFGTPAFNLNPITNSNGAITFTSSDTSVATVFNSTVTILKAGTTTINLVQDASGNYLQGTSSAVLTVNKVVTLLSGVSNIVTSFADIFTLEYNSNSDGALSYVFSDPDIATIFGSTVTATKVGSTTITVTQAETENYFSDTLSFVLTVNKADPSLSNFVNIENTYGDASFNIVAPITFSSGAFTYVSSNIAVAVVSDSTVTIVGAGTTTITATQETTDYYLQDSITCLLTVNKASPLLSIFEYITKTYGDPPFNIITPTSLSSGAFTYSSSNSSRAIVVDDVITIVKAGFVAIIVTQEETDNYFSETTYGILAIYKQDTHLSVFEDIVKTYGDGDFDLLEPQSSRLGYYTYISSNESVAVIVNNTVTIHSGGVTTIMAIQDETETHKQGLITCSLKIHRINSTLNYIDVLLIDGSYKIKVDTNSTGLFTYSVSDSTVVTINEDNTLSFLQPGDVTIIATQSETASYYSGEFSTIVSYTGA